MATKAAKNKLIEMCWAIRIGTFKSGKPKFLDLNGSPSTFEYRNDALAEKKAAEDLYDRSLADWVIVRVKVMET